MRFSLSLSLSVRQFGTRLQLFAAIPSGDSGDDVPSVTVYNFFVLHRTLEHESHDAKHEHIGHKKEQVLWSSMGRGGGKYSVLH
jgi:hypothetical protein